MTIEQYDLLAQQFYDETGIMAPGKDAPVMLGETFPYGARQAEWQKWLRDMSEGSKARMKYAEELTYESMAMCGVPPHLRIGELNKVHGELMILIKVKKEEFPESETERKWREREIAHWEYDGEL